MHLSGTLQNPVYLAGLTLNKLSTGFGPSLGSEIEGIEGFSGSPFPPPNRQAPSSKAEQHGRVWRSWRQTTQEIPPIFLVLFLHPTDGWLWRVFCEGMQENGMQVHISRTDFVNPLTFTTSTWSHMTLNRFCEFTGHLLERGVGEPRNHRAARSQALPKHPCSLQKEGYAWESRHAKNGLVKTLMPLYKLD